MNLLSMIIFFPFFSALFGFFIPKEKIKAYGISIAFIECLLTLLMWYFYETLNGSWQLTEVIPLIPSFGINYYVGVDGISLFLVILSALITFLSILGLKVKGEEKNLIISVLFLEMTMMGVFLCLDAIIFYIFWELSLLPMLYIIGVWGDKNRIYAAVKFFLYTFFGSVFMLVGILAMGYFYYKATGIWSFSLSHWYNLSLPFHYQLWLFLGFFIGFAIKVPMVPFHTWLPYAHGQAPTIGSVILAAILLKMGTYGFIRFSLPLFPDASVYFTTPIGIMAVIMVIYTGLIAFAQEDMKQVIAYSSISHMGVMILGIFALNVEGISGSIFLMISHGITSGALFLLVGVIYERRHTKLISQFGGLALVMPKFASFFAIILMGSIGLPLTIGFVGEFLSLIGFFKTNWIIAAMATSSIVISAIYMLNLFKKCFFGVLDNEKNKDLKDLNSREIKSILPLVVLVVILGIYPKPLLDPINSRVHEILFLMNKKVISQEGKLMIMNANSIAEVGK